MAQRDVGMQQQDAPPLTRNHACAFVAPAPLWKVCWAPTTDRCAECGMWRCREHWKVCCEYITPRNLPPDWRDRQKDAERRLNAPIKVSGVAPQAEGFSA